MSSSTPPYPSEPEYLSYGPGEPPTSTGSRRGRRPFLIGGGVVGALAVIGGGAWAASWYLGSGPTAAEILPADTVAYAQINLDPSGDQKIAALKLLNSFPGFAKEAGISSTDDLRQKAWEGLQSDGTCAGVDYDTDIKPWLGDRMSVAAVDEGSKTPVPVLVVQVQDEGKANSGLAKLASCAGADSTSGFVVKDGWAVIAQTSSKAQMVFDEAGQATLADDADYQRLTKETGSAGVITAYAAPKAGDVLSDLISSKLGALSRTTSTDNAALKSFGGLALQVRFSTSGLEVEYAGTSTGHTTDSLVSSGGAQEVRELPDDTAAALGTGLKSGWADQALDAAAKGAGTSRSALVAQAQRLTGLTLPDDAETLLGRSFALAVSGDIDVDAIVNSADPSSIPVGVKVDGRAADVERVLAKLRASTGESSLLRSTSQGDQVAFGPDDAWNRQVAADGSLGDSATFKAVLPDAAKAGSILYLNADAHDWLVKALQSAGASSEEIANVKPLQALGIASWVDGSTTHGRLRLTIN